MKKARQLSPPGQSKGGCVVTAGNSQPASPAPRVTDKARGLGCGRGREGIEMRKRGKGEVCTYCRRHLEPVGSRGRLAATMDHVLPQSKGGKGPWVRKVWCCRQCNTLKGSMMPDVWSAFMAATPEWWKREEYKVPRTKRAVTAVSKR